MTEEEIEKVARAIEASLYNEHDSHGCRADGPRDGKDMTVHGHINLPAVACAAITALDQHREGKAKGLSRKHYRHTSEATYPLAFAAPPTKEDQHREGKREPYRSFSHPPEPLRDSSAQKDAERYTAHFIERNGQFVSSPTKEEGR